MSAVVAGNFNPNDFLTGIFDTRADTVAVDLSGFQSITINRWNTASPHAPATYSRVTAPKDITGQNVVTRPDFLGNQTATFAVDGKVYTALSSAALVIGESGSDYGYVHAINATNETATNNSLWLYPGLTYTIMVDVASYTSGTVTPRLVGAFATVTGTPIDAAGKWTQDLVAPVGPTSVQLKFDGAANMKVSSLTAVPKFTQHFITSRGLTFEIAESTISPQMFGAVGDGVVDDSRAVTIADGICLGFKSRLVGRGTYLLGHTVQLQSRGWDLPNCLFRLKPSFPDTIGIIVDNTAISWPDQVDEVFNNVVTGRLVVDGDVANQSNPNLTCVQIRNMNTSLANPIFFVRNSKTGVKISGVSEEFKCDVHGENCQNLVWFADETVRPVTSDITPNIVHINIYGSLCTTFLRAQGSFRDSHTSFTADLHCENSNTTNPAQCPGNSSNPPAPAIDLLDPRGHYELRGFLRGIYGVGLHANQKFQTANIITYELQIYLNGLKIFQGAADTPPPYTPCPAIHIESASVIAGWWAGYGAFNGGIFIDELEGGTHPGDPLQNTVYSAGNLKTSIYRLAQGPAMTLGTPGGERITNGAMSASGANWTVGAGWTVSGGVAAHTVGSTAVMSQPITVTPGQRYKVSYTVDKVGGATITGSVFVRFSGGTAVVGATTAYTAPPTTVTQNFIAKSGNNLFEIVPTSDFNGSVDNVSVHSSAVRSGIFDLAIGRIDDTSDALVVNSVDVDNNRRIVVENLAVDCDDGGAVKIFDPNVDLGVIHTPANINWNNEVDMLWLQRKSVDAIDCALILPAATTISFTPPATRGAIRAWLRGMPARMAGYYTVGSLDTELTKDSGHANVNVSSGSGALAGPFTADNIYIKARSDVNKLDIRSQYAATQQLVLRLGK